MGTVIKSKYLKKKHSIGQLLSVFTFMILFSVFQVSGKVVSLEIKSRTLLSKTENSGYRSGPYEVIKGIAHMAVDPFDPANGQIIDLKLAPRNNQGQVEFSAEFELHKPVDPKKGNGRLLYFVNNRGRKIGEYVFNMNTNRTENWLYSQGYTYLYSGWNCDVIERNDRLNIRVPVATNNGQTITGKVYSEITNFVKGLEVRTLVWGGSIPYPPADLNEADAILSCRKDRRSEAVMIPRSQWRFAIKRDGKLIPDPGHLYVKGGFKRGWLYDLVYTAKNPKVTGLGMAGIRDLVSYFRYKKKDRKGKRNPMLGSIQYAYSWGHSQSGRLLNHFLYENFNGDEKKRIVFDGIISNCPGAGKGLFNARFAQFTRHGSHHEDNLYPTDFFPQNTVMQKDPLTGKRKDPFQLARKSSLMPKIFYINQSTDYWTRAASLLHSDVEGKTDAAIDPNVRIYLVSSGIHGNNYWAGVLERAMIRNLDQWIVNGTLPPSSKIPKISNGTLVSLSEYRKKLAKIPGMKRMPDSYYQPLRLDPGPRWRTEGIADIVPPKIGKPYISLVPQVDRFGNDLAGIRLPRIRVPLATHTGWQLYDADYYRSLGRNRGSLFPLSRDKAEARQKGDTRPSLAELYPTGSVFLKQMQNALADLKQQRFLLESDYREQMGLAKLQSELILNIRHLDEIAVERGGKTAHQFVRKMGEADLFWIYGMSDRQLMARLNQKGYEWMQKKQVQKAYAIFELGTLLYDKHWNSWDSFAEWHYEMKQYQLAIKYYRKSLELNPKNKDAMERVRKIQDLLKQEK